MMSTKRETNDSNTSRSLSLPIIAPAVWTVAAGDSTKNGDKQALIDIEHHWANAYMSGDAEKLASIFSYD